MLSLRLLQGLQGAQGLPPVTQLFEYQQASGNWELSAASVNPHFFNPNEDQRGSSPSWCLEAGEMELQVQ